MVNAATRARGEEAPKCPLRTYPGSGLGARGCAAGEWRARTGRRQSINVDEARCRESRIPLRLVQPRGMPVSCRVRVMEVHYMDE